MIPGPRSHVDVGRRHIGARADVVQPSDAGIVLDLETVRRIPSRLLGEQSKIVGRGAGVDLSPKRDRHCACKSQRTEGSHANTAGRAVEMQGGPETALDGILESSPTQIERSRRTGTQVAVVIAPSLPLPELSAATVP